MTDDTEWIDVTEADDAAALRYALVIEWSTEDQAFVVSVPDIPRLHTHGATREEAAAMGNEAVALWLAGARETGIRIPPPSFSALRKRPAAPDAERIRQIRQRLDLSLPEAAISAEVPGEGSKQPGDAVLTEKELKALQKKNLINALKQANWRVSGKTGAAELLGIRPTTLNDRIRAFGIKKPH